MEYTTAYTVINKDNGETMGSDSLEALREAVASREDFRGAELQWVVKLIDHLTAKHPELLDDQLQELYREFLQAGWTPVIRLV